MLTPSKIKKTLAIGTAVTVLGEPLIGINKNGQIDITKV